MLSAKCTLLIQTLSSRISTILISDITIDMARETRDTLSLELRRFDLEEDVANLRKSLQHWQKWAAEYEGIKEEILAAGSECTAMKLVGLVATSGCTISDVLSEMNRKK